MMTDEVWRRDEIESPCVKVCIVHPESRLCIGCLRSIDEIREWTAMGPDARLKVMAELPLRKGRVKGRRKGGRARNRAE